MFCKKCGHEVKEGTKFCTHCGTPISQPAQAGEKTDEKQYEKNDRKAEKTASDNKKGKLLIGILLGVILFAIAVIAGLIYGISRQGKETTETVLEEDQEKDSKKESQKAAASTEEKEPQETEKEGQADSSEAADGAESQETGKEETSTEAPAGEGDSAHTYKIFVEDVTWLQAFQKAQQMGGYLVNINSEEEQQQILDMIKEEGYEKNVFWLGARNAMGSYYWIDRQGNISGSSLNASDNWMKNEPSYYDVETGALEDYVDMFYFEKENRFVWNDVPNDITTYYKGRISYIVEFEPGGIGTGDGEKGSSGSDGGWKQAYIDYIDSCDSNTTNGFALIYVDGDDIPELVDVGDCEATGTRIITYSEGKAYTMQLSRLSFTYIEKENLLDNDGGHMGYYFDHIYSMVNGHMCLIYQGEYYGDSPDMSINEETGRWSTTTYQWQGVSVNEITYWQELNKVYDTSKAKYGYDWDNLYSFERAKEVIESL